MLSPFCWIILWSSICILLEVLSWNVEYLSIHIWCNAAAQKELFFSNPSFISMLVETPSTKLIRKHSVPLTSSTKSLHICVCVRRSSSKWNKLVLSVSSRSSKGVESSYSSPSTSFWIWASILLLNLTRNSWFQSSTREVSSSGSAKHHV